MLALIVLSAFAEIFSIGAVLPFLGVLTAPDRVFEHEFTRPFIQFLGFTTPDQLLLPLTIAFCLATFLAGAMRLLLLRTSINLAFATGCDLGNKCYRNALYQSYSFHIARNSSALIDVISNKVNSVMFFTMLPALTLASSAVILSAILVALFYIEPVVAVVIFGGFGIIYTFIVKMTRKQMLINSASTARASRQVIQYMQEGVGGIRDILIDGSQETYCDIYRNVDYSLRRSQGSSTFITSSPRYVMETLGMLLIAVIAYMVARQADGVAKAVPILGAFAVGAQRLLPVMQQAYSSWASIRSSQFSLQETLELLDLSLPDYADLPAPIPLPFKQSIVLNNLSFRYDSVLPWVLKDINLTIPKGSRLGFVGITGSGKSTLIDLLMGLLQPTEGAFFIDGQDVTASNYRAWQAHIAHVPQTIFLADSTIEENIAFGIPKDQINNDRVRQAARQAQIADFIETCPEKYHTLVGERGVQLSGGQRQRIGIARALYKQVDVIIFDEATSALDSETEQAVMGAIDALEGNLTILIVAHRVTTLKNCTQIVELGNGGILRVGSYQDILVKLE